MRRSGVERMAARLPPDISCPELRARRAGDSRCDIWPVSFMDYDLADFDLGTRVLEPLLNRSAQKCYPRLRYVV